MSFGYCLFRSKSTLGGFIYSGCAHANPQLIAYLGFSSGFLLHHPLHSALQVEHFLLDFLSRLHCDHHWYAHLGHGGEWWRWQLGHTYNTALYWVSPRAPCVGSAT
jgi:hypothetical protein